MVVKIKLPALAEQLYLTERGLRLFLEEQGIHIFCRKIPDRNVELPQQTLDDILERFGIQKDEETLFVPSHDLSEMLGFKCSADAVWHWKKYKLERIKKRNIVSIGITPRIAEENSLDYEKLRTRYYIPPKLKTRPDPKPINIPEFKGSRSRWIKIPLLDLEPYLYLTPTGMSLIHTVGKVEVDGRGKSRIFTMRKYTLDKIFKEFIFMENEEQVIVSCPELQEMLGDPTPRMQGERFKKYKLDRGHRSFGHYIGITRRVADREGLDYDALAAKYGTEASRPAKVNSKLLLKKYSESNDRSRFRIYDRHTLVNEFGVDNLQRIHGFQKARHIKKIDHEVYRARENAWKLFIQIYGCGDPDELIAKTDSP